MGAVAAVHVVVVVVALAEELHEAEEAFQEVETSAGVAETSTGAVALTIWVAVKCRADAPTQVDLLALDKRARGQRAAVNAPMSVAAGLVTSILVGQELEPVH